MSRTQSAGSNLQEVVLTNNPYATRVTEEEARRKAVEAEFLRHNPLKQQPIGGAKIEQKLEERQTNMNDKGKKSMIGSPVHTEVGKRPADTGNPKAKAAKAVDKSKEKAPKTNDAAEEKSKGNRMGSLFKTGANKKTTEAEKSNPQSGKPEETDKQKPIEQQIAAEDKGKQGMMGGFFGARADKKTVKPEPTATKVQGNVEQKLAEQPDNSGEKGKRSKVAGLFQTGSDKKAVVSDQPQAEAAKRQGEHKGHHLAPQVPASGKSKAAQTPRPQPKPTNVASSVKHPTLKHQSPREEQSKQGVVGKSLAKPESHSQKTTDPKVGNAEKVPTKAANVGEKKGKDAKDKKESGIFRLMGKRTAQPVAADKKVDGEHKLQPPFEGVRTPQNTKAAYEGACGSQQKATPTKQQEGNHEKHPAAPDINHRVGIPEKQQERKLRLHPIVSNINQHPQTPGQQEVPARMYPAGPNMINHSATPKQQEKTSKIRSVSTNINQHPPDPRTTTCQHQASPKPPTSDSRRILPNPTPKSQPIIRKPVKEPVQSQQHQLPLPAFHTLNPPKKASKTPHKPQQTASPSAQAAEKAHPNLPHLSSRRERKQALEYSSDQKSKKAATEQQDAAKKRAKDLADHAKLVEKARRAEADAEQKRLRNVKEQCEAREKAEREIVVKEKKRVEERQKAEREKVEKERRKGEKREKEKTRGAVAGKQAKGVVPVKTAGKKVVVMPKTGGGGEEEVTG
ncbi:TolA, Membrane protein involved in colicin uptake [Pyrenophora tritici-repentis]|uniref:TolA, Membrane protein involved in colicin uptake n=1 Tax=Pyrenophora tritici-repentis TaxID=45151 RepID=A0A834RU93_9PLEO|nr:TolA, Membrane protein involved in colicin uptake [Pyrenophora tritici-repentis]